MSESKHEAEHPAAAPAPHRGPQALLDVIGDLEEALNIPSKRQRGVCWTCGVDHDNEARLNRAVMSGILRRLRAATAPASPPEQVLNSVKVLLEHCQHMDDESEHDQSWNFAVGHADTIAAYFEQLVAAQASPHKEK